MEYFVVGVVVIGVELFGVGDDAGGVDGEVVVGDRVFDVGVGARVAVCRLDFQDRRPDGQVLVDVVRLVVGQFEFGHVVVHVRHPDRQLIKNNHFIAIHTARWRTFHWPSYR